MRQLIIGLAAVVVLVGVGSAEGESFDLAPPPETYAGQTYVGGWVGGPVGGHRGFILEDVAAFALNSVGIEMNLSGVTTLTANLYDIIGTDTVGALLATYTEPNVQDTDRGFYDVPLTYGFAGDSSRYLIDITWDAEPSEAVFYDFEGVGDFGLQIDPHYTRGPVKVIDGKGGVGSTVGSENFIIAHFRMDAIPEPSTLALLCMAAFGLLMHIRRKR